MQVYTIGRIVWWITRKEKQDFGFLDETLMPYIIGHKRYFIWYLEFWVFRCNSYVILWLVDFIHMNCRYTWMLRCLTFLNHVLMCIHFSFLVLVGLMYYGFVNIWYTDITGWCNALQVNQDVLWKYKLNVIWLLYLWTKYAQVDLIY